MLVRRGLLFGDHLRLRLVGELDDVVVAQAAQSADDELFVEACGGGVFATAIERGKEHVEDSAAFVGNEIDRGVALLRMLVEDCRPSRWQVEIDGSDHSGDYLAVEVMNIRFAGPGVPLAPHATPGDGNLEIALVKDADRSGLLDYFERRLAHDEVALPELTVVTGREVRLLPPDGKLRVDDELHDGIEGEVRVNIMAGAVQIVAATERRASTRRSTTGDRATAPPRSSGKSGPASGKANGRARTAQRS